MNVNEARHWLEYAQANLGAARKVADAGYFNPSLQDAQQAVEKALKAVMIVAGIGFKKTHSIREIKAVLCSKGLVPDISDEDCRLFDALYLPSKYPLGGILPDSEPDAMICDHCIQSATRVVAWSLTQMQD